MIVAILLNTPLWVFFIFTLLIWLGAFQLRTRSVSIHRIWLTPMVFIVWGLLGLILRNAGSMSSLMPWMAAAIIGALLGLSRRNTLAIDHVRGIVKRPASVLPLLRNLIVFGVHYGLNIAAAFHPGQHSIMQVDMAVSGLFAGYFAGWLVRFMQRNLGAGTAVGGSANRETSAIESAAR